VIGQRNLSNSDQVIADRHTRRLRSGGMGVWAYPHMVDAAMPV
jgi:hypothetical protein